MQIAYVSFITWTILETNNKNANKKQSQFIQINGNLLKLLCVQNTLDAHNFIWSKYINVFFLNELHIQYHMPYAIKHKHNRKKKPLYSANKSTNKKIVCENSTREIYFKQTLALAL